METKRTRTQVRSQSAIAQGAMVVGMTVILIAIIVVITVPRSKSRNFPNTPNITTSSSSSISGGSSSSLPSSSAGSSSSALVSSSSGPASSSSSALASSSSAGSAVPYGCNLLPCLNGGTCIPVGLAGFTCDCLPGVSGSLCEIPGCSDSTTTQLANQINITCWENGPDPHFVPTYVTPFLDNSTGTVMDGFVMVSLSSNVVYAAYSDLSRSCVYTFLGSPANGYVSVANFSYWRDETHSPLFYVTPFSCSTTTPCVL